MITLQDPKTKHVCNNNGACECGACKCREDGDKIYIGKFCGDCPTCKRECDKLIDLLSPETVRNKLTNVSDPLIQLNYVDTFSDIKDYVTCELIHDNCHREVRYRLEELTAAELDHTSEPKLLVEVSNKEECFQPVATATIVGSTVGAVLFVGLLTLILWKLFTYFIDKHEYEKFERERKKAAWQGVRSWQHELDRVFNQLLLL